jgi:hypothetical protein
MLHNLSSLGVEGPFYGQNDASDIETGIRDGQRFKGEPKTGIEHATDRAKGRITVDYLVPLTTFALMHLFADKQVGARVRGAGLGFGGVDSKPAQASARSAAH